MEAKEVKCEGIIFLPCIYAILFRLDFKGRFVDFFTYLCNVFMIEVNKFT